MTRLGGRCALPELPANNRKIKTAAELAAMSESARAGWKKEMEERNIDIENLRRAREDIISLDAKWELSPEAKTQSDQRMRELVCPTPFFNRNKPVWEFTGSWKTNDWQHFMERHAALALYGFLDDDRLSVLLEIFSILSVLAKYSHTRNELSALRARAIRALVQFQEIGPLQEQTIVFHLIIHLVDQSIRWGPPASVWMYPYERYLGFLCRQLKSKRYPEENLVRRYCKSRATCAGFDSASMAQCNRDLEASTPSKTRGDKFPKKRRGDMYRFCDDDGEQLHDLFLKTSTLYKKVCAEWKRAHSTQNIPCSGQAIRRWSPFAERHQESKSYQRNNQVSLQSAMQHFCVETCRAITSGVWHSGERRSGALDATADHIFAESLFEFTPGDTFLFELKVHALVSAGFEMVKLAKVQILDYLGLMLRPNCNERTKSPSHCGAETNWTHQYLRPSSGSRSDTEPDCFFILPWSRQVGDDADNLECCAE